MNFDLMPTLHVSAHLDLNFMRDVNQKYFNICTANFFSVFTIVYLQKLQGGPTIFVGNIFLIVMNASLLDKNYRVLIDLGGCRM